MRALLVAGFLSGFYIIWNLDAIIARAGWWTQTDITWASSAPSSPCWRPAAALWALA
jgi:hypothetical protein